MRSIAARLAFVVLWLGCISAPALAASAPCGGDFNAWLDGFKQEAAAQGVSQGTIQSALAGVTYDPGIIARDHAQGVFRQSFEQFSGRMVPPRLSRGREAARAIWPGVRPHRAAIRRARCGHRRHLGPGDRFRRQLRQIPDHPLAGAALAYDCRRPDKFRGELLAALRIVDRGDMAPSEMRGAWAGEIGQTQFLPSSYLKYAVDYDGNGRRDLIHSVPDVLASTANYLKGYGWQRGQPWGEGTANFQVLLQWNASQVYTKTVAYFAQRLAGGS